MWCYQNIRTLFQDATGSAPALWPWPSTLVCRQNSAGFWSNNILNTITPSEQKFRHMIEYLSPFWNPPPLDAEVFASPIAATCSTQAAAQRRLLPHQRSLARGGRTLTKHRIFAAVSLTRKKCPMCGNAGAVQRHYAENYMLAISIITGCHLSAQTSH